MSQDVPGSLRSPGMAAVTSFPAVSPRVRFAPPHGTIRFTRSAHSGASSVPARLVTAAIAEKMLKEYGEFLPFGGKILTSDEIVHVGASDGREQPPSIDLINLMREGFSQEAKEGELKATAIVYDVRTIPPGMSEKMDAIQIDFNHRDDYSVSVVFPYILKDGQIEYGDIFAARLDFSPFQN